MKHNIMKSVFSACAVFVVAFASGCDSGDRSLTNSENLPAITLVGGKELTDFELNSVEAYNYDTGEIYTIDGAFYNPIMFTGGAPDDEEFVFQGQKCSVSSTKSSYILEMGEEGYNAKLSEAYVNSSDWISIEGVAYFDGEFWVLRPLRYEGDTVLPLLGDFSDEQLAEIDDLSTVEISGEKFKTHPFIFHSIQNLGPDNEPDILSDESRAYLVKLETEGLTFYASNSEGVVHRRDGIFYNRVTSAEDIGETPF